MPGRHALEPKSHPRHARSGALLPIASAAVATAILAGGAYSVSQMSFEPADQAALAIDRTPEHVSRDLQRVTPSASASPALSPSAIPSKAAVTPTASRRVLSSGTCEASFYDEPQGTANGEVFDPTAMTAAHKTLKFNSRVRVTNLANGKSVIVRINDRGPYIDGRCLDLSRASFAVIANLGAGHVDVKYEVLG